VLAGLAFLQIVQWFAASFSLAQLFGFGEEAVANLTSSPVQPPSLFSQLSTEFIQFGFPFSPQILIGLILPVILAAAYMLWLVVWGLNQQDSEQSNNRHSQTAG
jgi:hypothetical protein